MRSFYTGALAHAAAGQNRITAQLAVLIMRDDADIVGVYVCGVIAGKGEVDLEFARQIGCAVERLHIFGAGGVLAVYPNVVVGGGLRSYIA